MRENGEGEKVSPIRRLWLKTQWLFGLRRKVLLYLRYNGRTLKEIRG